MKAARTDADRFEVPGFGRRPLWALVLAGLVAGQAMATLGLFDPQHQPQALLDDRPILNGAHPLHLYHGLLGARSWREGGFGSCYDPAFQAGYPKTPIFDSGSRPAELFLLIGREHPAAYKIGLALCCLVMPLVFAASVRLLDLAPGTACLAAGFGILAWWGGPAQRLFERGQVDWLLAGLNLLLHAALVVRFHRYARPPAWLGLIATAALGWFLHPILWIGFILLFIPFYLFLAPRHALAWNVAILSAWLGGLLVNIGWLRDWVRFCWIQLPVPFSPRTAAGSGLVEWFSLDLGGTPADRLTAAILLMGGLLGVVALLTRRRFAPGFLFGATVILLPAFSLGAGLWKSLEPIGVAKLFVLGCIFAVVPAAVAIGELFALANCATAHPVRGTALILAGVAAAAICLRDHVNAVGDEIRHPPPLQLGFTADQQALVRTLRMATRSDVRILWEERAGRPLPLWTALLPGQTERAFIGGLDPEAGVDHAEIRLTSTHLAGRPLADWTDAELADFCTRFNIGHIVCWTPQVAERFRSWSLVDGELPLRESGDGWLFTLNRRGSFVLKGKARVVELSPERIALTDAEPEAGVVVLSLHFQDGFRIVPSEVRVEREQDPDDPVPRLRLRLPGRVLRVTLTWGKP